MTDRIAEVLNDLLSKSPQADLYQAVQAGITSGAVSLRARAMAQCDLYADVNDVKNGIGRLSDIE